MSARNFRLRPNLRWRLVAMMAACVAVCAGLAHAAEEIVTMRDGRQYRGEIEATHNGKVLRIDAGERIVTVSAAQVAKREPAPADFDVQGYRIIGQPVTVLDPNRRMGGRPAPGHAWNVSVQNHGLKATGAIADPKLGNITVEYALVSITTRVGHYKGVNYDEYFFRPITDFPESDLWHILEQQITQHAAGDKLRGYLEMAHFFRQIGNQSAARRAIEIAEREANGQNPANLAEERRRIDAMPDTARVAKIRRAVDRRMPEAAFDIAKQIQSRDGLDSRDREFLETYIGETEKRIQIRDSWRAFATDLAGTLGGAAAPQRPQANGEWLGLPCVEPLFDWPAIDPANLAAGWAERAAWLSVMLCSEQAASIEADWGSTIHAATDPATKAKLLWLAAWYAGILTPSDAPTEKLDDVLKATALVARWAAAPRDAKRDLRRDAAKLGSIGPVAFQKIVAASHLLPVPASERPFTGAWGTSELRQYSAPVPGRNGKPISYIVRLPADYHPGLTYPLIVLWHGLNSSPLDALNWFDGGAYARGFILASAEYCIEDRQYTGNAAQNYALPAVIEDVSRRFRVDPDRAFMFGGSMGGFGAWGAGMQYFDRLAGIATVIGAPIGLAKTVGPIHAQQVPVYAIGGENDATIPDTLRTASSTMQELGADFIYSEYKGAGHIAFPQEYPVVLDWMLRLKRNPAPAKVDSIVVRDEESWRYWIDIDTFRGRGYEHNNVAGVRTSDLPRVTCEWNGNKLTVDASDDATKVTVYFDRRLVNFDADIIVEINGREVFSGTARPSIEDALEACENRGDRGTFYEYSRSIRVPRRR